jgi:PII-like signaling protein
MANGGDVQRLRIYISEGDRWEGRPLYEAIVRAARDAGLAGAMALRGVEGFGGGNQIHTVKVLHLSENLPILIEIIDQPDRIARFLPTLDKMLADGLATLENVKVVIMRHRAPVEDAADDELQLDTPDEPLAPTTPTHFRSATDRSRQIIEAAKEEADRAHRGFVDSVDVLLAMLCEPGSFAGLVLKRFDVGRETVEKRLREQVSRETPTDQFLSLLDQKSRLEANWLDQRDVGAEHLLLALCETRPSAATDILMQLGIQPRDVCHEVLEILGHGDAWQRWLADHPDM